MLARKISSGFMLAVLGGVFFQLVATPISGQALPAFQSPEVKLGVPSPEPSGQPPATVDNQRKGLQRLRWELKSRQQGSQTLRSKGPTIVCGMKMYEVSPKADEKILLPPAERPVDPKIKVGPEDAPPCGK